MMLNDYSTDVLACPNEACRDGMNTDTFRKCLDCKGSGYVVDKELSAWEDRD